MTILVRAVVTGFGLALGSALFKEARERLGWLLDELGRRRFTNVLVEGGSQLLGSLIELGEIDEVHAFIAPKLLGGRDAPGPIAGPGLDLLGALRLENPQTEPSGEDTYVHGRIARG